MDCPWHWEFGWAFSAMVHPGSMCRPSDAPRVSKLVLLGNFPSAQKQQFITEPSRIKAVLVARPLGPSDARAHPQAPGGQTRGPRVRLGASQLYLQKAGGGAHRVNVLCSPSSSGLSAVMHRLSKVMVQG